MTVTKITFPSLISLCFLSLPFILNIVFENFIHEHSVYITPTFLPVNPNTSHSLSLSFSYPSFLDTRAYVVQVVFELFKDGLELLTPPHYYPSAEITGVQHYILHEVMGMETRVLCKWSKYLTYWALAPALKPFLVYYHQTSSDPKFSINSLCCAKNWDFTSAMEQFPNTAGRNFDLRPKSHVHFYV